MEKIEFKIALLDCMSYPISRHTIQVEKPVTEETLMLALKKVLPELTHDMSSVEKEEDALINKDRFAI